MGIMKQPIPLARFELSVEYFEVVLDHGRKKPSPTSRGLFILSPAVALAQEFISEAEEIKGVAPSQLLCFQGAVDRQGQSSRVYQQ